MLTQEELQKKKKKKPISESDEPYEETLESVHNELEHALTNCDRSDNTAFAWTIKTAEMEAERLRKEGKSSEKDISKICSIICDQHPVHERQIQRYFDYVDKYGNRPHRKYKRQYTKEELAKATHVGNMSEEEQKELGRIERDNKLKADDAIVLLQDFLGDEIYEYGSDKFHEIADLLHRGVKHAENEFKKNGLNYINPYDTKRSSGWDKEKDRTSQRKPPLTQDEAKKKLIDLVRNEWIGLQGDIDMIIQHQEQYSPDDLEIIKNMIKGIKSFREMLNPYHKKTWKADLAQWMEILTDHNNADFIRLVAIDYEKLARQCNIQKKHYTQDEILKGLDIEKHGGGTHPLQDLQDYIDPNTGKTQRVKLSKKRIEITEILDVMRFICRNIPLIITMSEYWRAKEQGYRKKRIKDVSDKRN